MTLIRPKSARRLFQIFGALLVVAGLADAAKTAAFLHVALRAVGTVQDGGPGGRHPVIQFDLPSGKTIGLVGGGILKAVAAGDAVPVLYDPADPVRTATPDRAGALWFRAILMLVLGSALLITGLYAEKRS